MGDILIVGKDLPDNLDFAEGFVTTRKVFTTEIPDTEVTDFESEGIFSCLWNRNSAISSRALILNAETKLDELTDVLVYFDAYYFCQQFELDRTEDLSVAIDTMISSYQFFMSELLFRLEQRKDPITIGFLVKTYPSKFEKLHTGSKNVNTHPASNIVNAAQSAFISLAENVSTLVGDKSYLSVILAKCEPGNELYETDKELAKWMAQSFDAIHGMKSKQTVKQAAAWIKAGGKVSTGFSLFK